MATYKDAAARKSVPVPSAAPSSQYLAQLHKRVVDAYAKLNGALQELYTFGLQHTTGPVPVHQLRKLTAKVEAATDAQCKASIAYERALNKFRKT